MNEKYAPQIGDLFEDKDLPPHPMLVVEVTAGNVIIQDTFTLEFIDCLGPQYVEWEGITLISRALESVR